MRDTTLEDLMLIEMAPGPDALRKACRTTDVCQKEPRPALADYLRELTQAAAARNPGARAPYKQRRDAGHARKQQDACQGPITDAAFARKRALAVKEALRATPTVARSSTDTTTAPAPPPGAALVRNECPTKQILQARQFRVCCDAVDFVREVVQQRARAPLRGRCITRRGDGLLCSSPSHGMFAWCFSCRPGRVCTTA